MRFTVRSLGFFLLIASLAPAPVAAQYGIQVTSHVTARTPIPGNYCIAPPAESNFLTTDTSVWIMFTYTGGQAGDQGAVEWLDPSGKVYFTSNITQTGNGGSYCYGYYISIYGYPPALQPGTWTVRLRWNGSQAFSDTFTIAAPPASSLTLVTNTLLPQATQGAPYNLRFSASGGTAPYTFSISHGSAPQGLTLSSAGLLSGTPAAAGSFLMTIHVADSGGNALDRDVALPVALPSLTLGVKALSFTYTQGGLAPAPQVLNLKSTGSTLPFTVSSTASWLVAAPGSGTTPATVNVSISTQGLTPGAYQGTLSFKSTGASTFQQNIPVSLALLAAGSATVGGIINTAVGTDWVFTIPGGQAANAPLRVVDQLTSDGAGNLYAVDADNAVVVRTAPDGSATVVAGNGIQGYSGDGGIATQASLNHPAGIAVDPTGVLYISDTSNHRIRKVDASGVITTIAGTGHSGYGGDGSPAVAALLSFPGSLALDKAGNVFFNDGANHVLRRIGTDGIITTVAGNGQTGYSGEGAALQVAVNATNGLAFDSAGNLYFGDSSSHLRRLTPAGKTELVAGTGTAGFSGENVPATSAQIKTVEGIAVDAVDTIYFGDFNNGRVRRINRSGIISTYAGSGSIVTSGNGGPALSAGMNPYALAIDPQGNLWLEDFYTFTIRRVDQATLKISAVVGAADFRLVPNGSSATNAYLWFPRGVAADGSGNLLIADSTANHIQKVTPAGAFSTIAGTGSPGCCFDNGPATAALLNGPYSVTTDAAGSIYFSDRGNHRVRKISTSGMITTVAGAGSFSSGGSFDGDAGPATKAHLNLPAGIAFDAAGNLFIADEYNHRVRRMALDGTISTFAGNGMAGYSGDGGPATMAQLNFPVSLAFDSAGNLYIADLSNNRVRMVTPGGTISTFAGNGKAGYSGDGGQAKSASLNGPISLTFDPTGNLYMAENGAGQRIRRISPAGIITTIAGQGFAGFAGDGGPSTQALINSPDGSMAVSNGNLYFTDTSNQRVRVIQLSGGTAPTFSAAPASISLTAVSGGAVSPQAALSVQSSSFGLPFQVVMATTSGGAWLQADATSATSPATINISADPTGLDPGAYQGTITLLSPYASPAQLTIAVTFQVTAVVSGHLLVGGVAANDPTRKPNPLSLQLQAGAAAGTAQITVGNTGSNAISFSTIASTLSGGSWLSVAPSSGSVSASSPVTLTVSADPGSLAGGVYTGTISLSSSDTTDPVIAVPVTMVISASMPVILISQTGLTFQAVQGGGNPLAQSIAVLNTGQGTMNWTATPKPLSGSGWLSVSQSSGTVVRPFLDFSSVDVTVNTAGLAPGNYFGQVSFNAAGANNGPQIVAVVLNVYPAGTPLGPEVRPSGLVFIGTPTSATGSQSVSLGNRGNSTVGFKSSDLTFGNVNWLSHVPAVGTVQLNTPSQITVVPDFTNRTAGVDKGVITVLFADGTTQTVSVLSVVPPSGTGSSSGVGESARASGCSVNSLVVQPTTLTDPSSAVALSQGANLEVRVADNCGNNIDNGTVSATFSSKDSPLTLAHTGGGRWSKTWIPVDSSQNRVVVTFRALLGQGIQLLSGSASVTVTLQSGAPQVPVTIATANAASFASTFVAPGGFVAVFGQEMAGATSQSNTLPLPSQVSGTQVLMAGRPLPLLYVAPGQINAQVPFNLAVNSTQQLVVMRGSSISVPQDVVVAAAQPAVYTQDQSGSGPGVIVDVNNALLTASNPAKAGDIVVIYCNGLGAVNPPVPEGVAATGLSSTVNPLTATIGGIPATVQFAGLTPGIPGLYQVNAVVPAGLPSGTQVPVVLTIAGQSSPPVTMAVR